MGEVGDGGGDNISSPAVFDGESDAEGCAEVAYLASFGDASEFANFDVDYIHGEVALGLEQHFERVDIFVEHKWMVGVSAD